MQGHEGEDLERVDLADPGRREERQPLDCDFPAWSSSSAADHRRQGRVLDDVHEQADERRQQPAEAPAAGSRTRGGRPSRSRAPRLPRAVPSGSTRPPARRLRHLGASPEGQRDRGRRERSELEGRPDRRQPEVDDEDGDQDRQAAEDLDVRTDQGSDGKEPDRQQRPEDDADQGARRPPPSRTRGALPAGPPRGCSGRRARPSPASARLSGGRASTPAGGSPPTGSTRASGRRSRARSGPRASPASGWRC